MIAADPNPTRSLRGALQRGTGSVLVRLSPLVLIVILPACRTGWQPVDPYLAREARLALYQSDPDEDALRLKGFDEEYEGTRGAERKRGSVGDVILAEFLAVFPGILWPGLGHYYAGDRKTATRLRRVGHMGILLGGVGGGIAAGGYYAGRENNLDGLSYSLYGTGGLIGVIGFAYFGTAWFYDIFDTPRAVLSGGKPPPRSRFVESLDIFGD